MTSSTDRTGSERHRIARWHRRHEDEVAELDPAEVTTVDDRRHLLPRSRSEGDRPVVPRPDDGAARRPGPDTADLEARVRAAEARAEEYAAELRRARADLAAAEERAGELSTELEQSEERSRTLAAETAARATEHSERVRALVAEREAAEERIAALERRLDEAHVLPTFAPVEPLGESPVEPEPEPEPEVEEPAVEVVEERPSEPEPQPEPVPESATPPRAAATSYDAHHGAGLLGPGAGVVALGCAAVVGWMAYQATVLDHLTLGLVLTVVALLGLAIALRQRSKSSEIHLENGTLRLRHGDRHHTFYLSSTSTHLEMTGQPGDKDWKVQVLRRGMAPVTIDNKDVDPAAFTEALRQWRPNL
jgi:hypothetical protein